MDFKKIYYFQIYRCGDRVHFLRNRILVSFHQISTIITEERSPGCLVFSAVNIWGRDKTATILQRAFSKYFFRIKYAAFQFKFYENLSPMVQLALREKNNNKPLCNKNSLLNWHIYASLGIAKLNFILVWFILVLSCLLSKYEENTYHIFR